MKKITQDDEFTELIKLYVANKISYETLVFNYPTHKSSDIKGFLVWLLRKVFTV